MLWSGAGSNTALVNTTRVGRVILFLLLFFFFFFSSFFSSFFGGGNNVSADPVDQYYTTRGDGILDLYSTLWERNKSDLFALQEARGAALTLQQSIQYRTWCLSLLA